MKIKNLARKAYIFFSDGLSRFKRYLDHKIIVKEKSQTLSERLHFVKEVDLNGQVKNRNFVEVDGQLKINWIIPPVGIGSGGHMTIFRMVHYLEQFGHKCEINVFGEKYKAEESRDKAQELKEIINKHFIKVDSQVRLGVDGIQECDALIATSWETAYPVYQNITAKNKFYFVQDFEPAFSPMSSYAHFAEQTYKFGFNHITAGPWLEKIIKQNYGGKAQSFNLAYDKDIYYPREKVKRDENTIVFYARPVTPRRGFEMAALALELVKNKRPKTKIIFFGWEDHEELPYEFISRGILSHESLAELYNRATIGLVISLTNYSLIPQEMMACNLPVVDIMGDNTKTVFGDDNQKIVLAEPTPQSIAKEIMDLLDSRERREKIAESGFNYVKDFSWEDEARKVERILLGR